MNNAPWTERAALLLHQRLDESCRLILERLLEDCAEEAELVMPARLAIDEIGACEPCEPPIVIEARARLERLELFAQSMRIALAGPSPKESVVEDDLPEMATELRGRCVSLESRIAELEAALASKAVPPPSPPASVETPGTQKPNVATESTQKTTGQLDEDDHVLPSDSKRTLERNGIMVVPKTIDKLQWFEKVQAIKELARREIDDPLDESPIPELYLDVEGVRAFTKAYHSYIREYVALPSPQAKGGWINKIQAEFRREEGV